MSESHGSLTGETAGLPAFFIFLPKGVRMKTGNFLLDESMTGLAVFFLIVLPFAAQAETQTETALVIDGRYEDWDLDKDYSVPMRSECKYTGKALPNVYLRYDSISNTVFVLVLHKEIMRDGSYRPTVNIYPLGHNLRSRPNDAEKISNFSWVMKEGRRVGWEGAFQLTAGSYDCDTGKTTGKGEAGELKRATSALSASEVEVIDIENLFFKCK